MSYIFDRFPSRIAAKVFAEVVVSEYHREAIVYDSTAAANAHDPFPYVLTPPIVHVERRDDGRRDAGELATELALERLAHRYRGVYAGT